MTTHEGRCDMGPPVFMGFSAKLPIPNPSGFTRAFEDIGSVSDCNRQTPIEGFRELNDWYETGFVKSERDLERAIQRETARGLDVVRARAYESLHGVVPPAPYRFVAYWIHPVWFNARGAHEGLHHALHPPLLAQPPDLSAYARVGYDVVSITNGAVGCSPLFCNCLANEIAVNRFCLLDDIEQAMDVGKRFGVEQPEPGDFVLFEVWRKTS